MHRGYFAREVRSNWFWGIILPIAALGLAWPTRGWSLLLFGGYLVMVLRMYMRLSRPTPFPSTLGEGRGEGLGIASLSRRPSPQPFPGVPGEGVKTPRRPPLTAYTFFTVLGKFPQAIGQAKYFLDRRRGRRSRVIEYKGPCADITREQVA
jgi:hypothetical protein